MESKFEYYQKLLSEHLTAINENPLFRVGNNHGKTIDVFFDGRIKGVLNYFDGERVFIDNRIPSIVSALCGIILGLAEEIDTSKTVEN